MTPRQWKDFYAAERDALGTERMMEMFDRAPRIELSPGGAIVFPHTRLTASGHLIAAAARAAVDSGRKTILALGVLHGRQDEPIDARGIHGPDMPDDRGLWHDEFSLDNFEMFLSLYAKRTGRAMPTLVKRFPLLVGHDPESLRGFDELRNLLARGAGLVATTDPIHHGVGYNTPSAELLPRNDPRTNQVVHRHISEAFEMLAARDFASFLAHAQANKSDFRDVGPVLASLLPLDFNFAISDLALVDYSDVLDAPQPTWVAASLVTISR